MKISLYLLGLITLCSQSLVSNTVEPVDMQVRKVTVYKNGYVFLTQEAPIKTEAQTLTLKNVVTPAYGTFWWALDAHNKVKDLTTGMVESLVPDLNYTLKDLILANENCPVTVCFHRGKQDEVIEMNGKILPQVVEETMDTGFVEEDKSASVVKNGDIFLLELNKGSIMTIFYNTVVDVQFHEKVKKPMKKVLKTELKMELLDSAKGETLSTTSLSKGMVWAPSYQLDISTPEKAVFRAQATVWNSLVDMHNVDLELTTGFPSILFSHVESPITLRGGMWQFLARLNGSPGEFLRENSPKITQNRVSDAEISLEEISFAAKNRTFYTTEVTQKNNMAFYKLSPFTCKKNETVTVDFMTFETECSMLYSVNIPAKGMSYTQSSSKEKELFDVWNYVLVKNAGNQPLTSAPIEFVNGGNVIAQMLMEYTPKGAEARIKMNKALDYIVERKELIKEQKDFPKLFKNEAYSIYTVEGEVIMRNTTDKDIVLEVQAQMSGIGEKDSIKDEGKLIVENQGYSYYKPSSTVFWKVTLPAKGEVKRTYTYTYKIEKPEK